MADHLEWDRVTNSWQRIHIDQWGTRSHAPQPREKTVEHLYLLAGIRNADSNEPGVSDKTFVRALNDTPACDELHIFIDSVGGHTRALTNMMAALNRHPAKRKITHCIGKAFSAAAALFLCGDERLMCPGSSLMIHNVHQGSDDTPQNCRLYSEAICDLIHHRCPDIDRATVREWMHRAVYVDCGHALRLGLATGLDLVTQPRVAVDASRASQPLPVTSFDATRRFDARVAATVPTVRQSQTTTPIPAARQIVIPPMPQCIQAALKSRPTAAKKFNVTCHASAGESAEFTLSGIIGDTMQDTGTVARFLRGQAGKRVNVIINSLGGSAYDGIAIFNQLTAHPGGCTTTIIGCAGSAASIIALAGQPVRIHDTASFFVHRAAIAVGGNQDDLSFAIEWLKAVDQGIERIYTARTGKPLDQIRAWMKGKVDGTIFTAAESLKAGFVDTVIPSATRKTAAAAASVPLTSASARAQRLRRNCLHVV